MQTNNAMIHKKFKKIKWYFNKMIIIPEEWNVFIINNICTLNAGGTPSRSKNEYWDNGDIPWLSSGEIDNNLITTTNEKISKLGLKNSATKLFPKKTVLIAITGFGTTRGKTSLLKIESATNQSIVGITIKKKILDEEYLWRYVQSQYYLLRNFAQGTQQPGLNLDIIKKFKIIMPTNILEQQKIASILSRVDALIETTQKTIENAKQLKKGLMQKLLIKGINHTKFKNIPWLFRKEIEIPIDWNIKRLTDIIIDKPEYGSGDAALPYDKKLPRYIRITDIDDDGILKNDQYVSVLLKNNKKYLLNDNDFLFARTGSVGRTFLFMEKYGMYIYAGYLIRFKLDPQKILPKFLFHYTHSINYWIWVTSNLTQGVQPNLNAQQYSKMNVILPPLKEQQKIASILSEVDAYIQSNQQYKEKLIKLKKGLMQKLLTGQIRVKF